MSEEEKEAIEYLEKEIVNTYSIGKARKFQTALNLIEKQQAVMNEMAKDLMQFVKEPVLLPNEIIKEYTKKVERNEDIN